MSCCDWLRDVDSNHDLLIQSLTITRPLHTIALNLIGK
jgi:hypothetical protein